MQVILKIFIVFAVACLFGCYADQDERVTNASMGVVKRGNEVVFQTPCGHVEIINPVSVSVGGGILEGAAVTSHPVITMKYANKDSKYDCWSYNESRTYEQTIRNFVLTDSLMYFIVGCTTTEHYFCHL